MLIKITVRLEVGWKVAQIWLKIAPKIVHSSFYFKGAVFKIAQKVTDSLGNFLKKKYNQGVTK